MCGCECVNVSVSVSVSVCVCEGREADRTPLPRTPSHARAFFSFGCLRGLDFAGAVLGTVSRVASSGHERPPRSCARLSPCECPCMHARIYGYQPHSERCIWASHCQGPAQGPPVQQCACTGCGVYGVALLPLCNGKEVKHTAFFPSLPAPPLTLVYFPFVHFTRCCFTASACQFRC